MMKLPSSLLENAVNEFAKLPGIGKKTALRLVLHLLKKESNEVNLFGETIIKLRKDIRYCTKCNSISDNDICTICNNTKRNNELICVVENIKDLIAIENTMQFNGLYHVLGGIISPIEGISPDKLNFQHLVQRVQNEKVEEIIIALNANTDGETTTFYIHKLLEPFPVKISTLARGIAFGSELEYTDELTLAKSISMRLPYNNSRY